MFQNVFSYIVFYCGLMYFIVLYCILWYCIIFYYIFLWSEYNGTSMPHLFWDSSDNTPGAASKSLYDDDEIIENASRVAYFLLEVQINDHDHNDHI